MSILDKILFSKRKEVIERKSLFPPKLLEQSIYFETTPVSLKEYLQRTDKSGIIAEIKRKSPSKGIINDSVWVERTSIGYMQAGASALSILTDKPFFGGDNEDLLLARTYNFCPVLRKDFIIDEYQIVEAKSIGADAILLIAAALTPEQLQKLAAFAQSLQLEVLMEVHDLPELQNNLHCEIDLIGVNNRDLKTFETNVNISKKLAPHIPKDYVKVSESGISQPSVVSNLKNCGYEGFLIGEIFMQHSRPEHACAEFIQELQTITNRSVLT